ncbi:flavin monoamine oxidase family protein [Sabulicella rubraurantiaca]|uniref:flavin monoamine oxidase family protein n=1 Tax=Sabulicella rubraurantiaca TaxID=2811429 RepID=UPI001A9656CA|nr:FAD-dependent oxidoreductase [Sabulicella rubraurantiaca]
MANEPDVDVAIIGGGISGIYAGWRLLASPLGSSQPAEWAQKRDGPIKVALFEGSDRIGGRLLSGRSPHMADTTAELGGMRYVAPAQKLVTALVERVLRLPFHEQVVAVDANIAFLRGRLLRSRDLASPAPLPFWFSPEEAAWLAARTGPDQTPSALIQRVLTRLMPDVLARLQAGTLREYLASVQVGGLPLWRHGFWNLLAEGMSPDGYVAARTTIGYDCLGGNSNALDLTAAFFDFVPGVSYRMVNDGYEAVPWQLQQRFQQAGGEVRFGTWLEGFGAHGLADGPQGVRLRFRDGSDVTARAVILAMPRRSIELLRPEGEVLGPSNMAFRQALASVTAIPLFKLFLLYPQCWWQQAGVTKGRSLTDMPLRQCYYWPSGPDGTGVPKPSEPGLLMAYDDLLNVSFWSGLDTRREVQKASRHPGATHHHHHWPLFPRSPAPEATAPGDEYAALLQRNWTGHTATAPMVREMHRQLMLMHGVDTAPEPIDAAYMDWGRDPYGGGVHLWNPNFFSDEMMPRMTQPLDGFPCYLCGEAYSTNQTWVEGALQTAEIVLQKRLGLPALELP